MIRKIIHIDEEKCNGCGACAKACHEGAIGMVSGKAKLLRDDYCDGLGDCLPNCPTGAISFVVREAMAYDEAAVAAKMAQKKAAEEEKAGKKPFTCPGSQMRQLLQKAVSPAPAAAPGETPVSRLAQWPCQIKLAPINAPVFDQAHLLIAADCTAYAYAGLHEEFMKGRVTLIGCPKLDSVDYSEKLTEIFAGNAIRSLTLVRMQVPCCGGMEMAALRARERSGKTFQLEVVTLTMDGHILKREMK